MISHKCYSNPHVLMMRSKASKDSSRSFQTSSEISFLISARKSLLTSGQTFDVTFVKKTLKKPGTLASQHPRMQQMLLLRAPAILPPRTDTDPQLAYTTAAHACIEWGRASCCCQRAQYRDAHASSP